MKSLLYLLHIPKPFFFDYSDGGILNSPNPEYIDGFHGSDRTYLKMVIQIVEKYPVLSCYFKDGKCLSDILQKLSGCRGSKGINY